MSMSYGVYIGPFLCCKKKPGKEVEIDELTEERITGIRGELSLDDGDVDYLGPNVEIEGIEREMSFSGHDIGLVVMRINQQAEMDAFQRQFGTDIAKLSEEYESVAVEWGVVPEFS